MVAAVFAGSRAPWGPDGEGPVRGVGVAVVLPLPRVEKAGRECGVGLRGGGSGGRAPAGSRPRERRSACGGRSGIREGMSPAAFRRVVPGEPASR